MMDATKGLKSLLAILDAQKLRGWTAQNELDHFTLCPTCGHWFDCRCPDSLIKHKHTTTETVVTTITETVVTTIMQVSGEEIRDPAPPLQNQNSPSNVAIEAPDLLPDTPASGAKP